MAYGDNEVDAAVNPYNDQRDAGDGNQKALRLQDRIAKNIGYDESVETAADEIMPTTLSEITIQEVDEASAETDAVNREVVSRTAETAPAELPVALSTYKAGYEQSLTDAESSLAYEISNIKNTPGSDKLTRDEIVDIAIRDHTKNMFAKVLDEQSTIEFGADIINMMLLPDESYNWSTLSKDANWFTSQQGLEGMAKTRAALGPSEQLKFDEALLEQLKGIESSEVQQFTTFLALYGEDPLAFLEQGLEKVGLAGTILKVGSGFVRSMRTLNKVKAISKAGDSATASILADLASTNPEAAAKIGMPQTDAAMSASPFKKQLKDVADGATEAPSSTQRNMSEDLDKTLAEIDNIAGVRANLSPTEQRDVADKWKKSFDEAGIEDVEITISDNQDIFMKLGDDAQGIKFHYTLDDLGGFIEKESSITKTFLRHAISPKALFGADKTDLVEAAVLGELQTSKAAKLYQDAAKLSVKGLNKKELHNVNAMLLELDGVEMDATRKALVNDGVGTLRLTDKEYDSFANVRKVFDHSYESNNRVIRRELEIQGKKNITIGGGNYYARNQDTLEKAKRSVHSTGGTSFDATIKDVDGNIGAKSFKSDELEGLYKEGYSLAVLEDNDKLGWFKADDGNHTRFALIKGEDVNTLPSKVLNKLPNYVPKERTDANFFVKRRQQVKVNGTKQDIWATKAFAGTQAEATRWLSKVQEGSKEFKAEDWSIAFNRETPGTTTANSDAIRVSGGMYKGSRSSEGLVDAATGIEGTRKNAFAAMQRSLNYTADRMVMNELRLVLKKRWYNDATAVDERIAGLPWKEARGAIEGSGAAASTKSRILAMHDQISHVSRVPTASEQRWQGSMRALGEASERRGWEDTAKYLYRGEGFAKNPVSTLKGGSFHLLLGFYNPAQYIVQLMGASVAVGANPVSFSKAVPMIGAASMVDQAGDVSSSLKAIKYLQGKGLVGKDAIKDWKLWDASGFRESVMRTNGDLDSAGNYMPMDAGAMKRAMGAVKERSTVFYEMGELANMRISFFTALENEKSRLGSAFTYSDANLRNVVSRAEDYRLNMSNANKASYQKGLMSLPTQFKSIYTKFGEALWTDGFTNAEKTRIIGTQILGFGAVGFPIFNHFADSMVNAITDDDTDASTRAMLKRGSVGYLVNDYWDIDAVVTGRVAVAGDAMKEIVNLWDSDVPALKAVLGASFTTGDRAFDFVNNMSIAGRMVWEADDVDVNTMGQVAKLVGHAFTSVPTSSRRITEAYYLNMFNEMRVSGKSMWTFAEDEVGMEDVIARGLGFSSQELEDVYKASNAFRDRKKSVREHAQVASQLLGQMVMSIDDNDNDVTRAYQLAMSVVMSDVRNSVDRKEILEGIDKELKMKDFRGRTYEQWIEYYQSDLLSASGKLFPTGQRLLEEETR